jgi:flavodoxin
MKSLVVYYSRTGNAKFVAETIAAEIGSDIEEIVDLKKRSGVLGFLIGGFDATTGKETEIAETKKLTEEYELVIVGTPVWNSRPTPAIKTYLHKNNLSGKKIAVFATLSGKKTQAIKRTKAFVPAAECVGELLVSKALENKQESEKQISIWCSKLRF